jgi:16S rRNA (cytidine1402-2'-O)-methyltransferase
MNKLEAGLYIISTPIGNLEDISFRAKNILNMVDLIICENPIHSLKLLNNLGIKKKLLSLHDYNEEILIKRIEKYQLTNSMALISDAGSPLISDPGYKLVLDYINKKLLITSIPGPSSLITALQLSGIPIHNFIFFGFVPKNKAGMKELIDRINNQTATSSMFISGKRLVSFVEEIIRQNIVRKMVICKEMTKVNEKVLRGSPPQILDKLSTDNKLLKGEFVVIISGQDKKNINKLKPQTEAIIYKILKKFSLTETVEIVHKLTDMSKKEVYRTALKLKK